MASDPISILEKLYCAYEHELGDAVEPYVRSHFTNRMAIERQVYSAKMYSKYISGRVLDWGCRHAPDSCILRSMFGSQVDIYGCDTYFSDGYGVFHNYSELKFTLLNHPYKLLYEDNFFDSVISSGVLEHVANDYESIKEVYRILKPGGQRL